MPVYPGIKRNRLATLFLGTSLMVPLHYYLSFCKLLSTHTTTLEDKSSDPKIKNRENGLNTHCDKIQYRTGCAWSTDVMG